MSIKPLNVFGCMIIKVHSIHFPGPSHRLQPFVYSSNTNTLCKIKLLCEIAFFLKKGFVMDIYEEEKEEPGASRDNYLSGAVSSSDVASNATLVELLQKVPRTSCPHFPTVSLKSSQPVQTKHRR